MKEQASLFQRMGGLTTIRLMVDKFYFKILEDHSISHFFPKDDMRALKSKQITFLSHVFGAPYAYDTEAMVHAHAHLSVKEEHFDAVVSHLESTLEEMNVKKDLKEEVMEIANSFKKGIVTYS